MIDVLAKREQEIATAVHGVCAAITNLGELQRDLDEASRDNIGENAFLAMKVRRIRGYLKAAAIELPKPMWAIMTSDKNIGGDELKGKVEAALGVEMGVTP